MLGIRLDCRNHQRAHTGRSSDRRPNGSSMEKALWFAEVPRVGARKDGGEYGERLGDGSHETESVRGPPSAPHVVDNAAAGW